MESIPVEALLDSYPAPMQETTDALRAIVRQAVPDAIERVRVGWRLIGYDVLVGWRTVYFAYVAPEFEHVHLGFEWGVFMNDPGRLLQGEGITKQVRWLTIRRPDEIREAEFAALVRESARIAAMTRSERFAIAVDGQAPGRDGRPG
jgi:hypothetical protein